MERTMEAILLGIDGTGPLTDGAYYAGMRNSFVSYIVRHSPARVKRYTRGPAFDGVDMGVMVAEGYAHVHLNLVAHPKAPVLLTGYSRGAAGVIGVAQRLAADGVRVKAMVLFDAVDRSFTIDTTEIPTNVDHVVYAQRDPHSGSRGSFSNCGTVWHSPTKVDLKRFMGTHGAMGGVPWPVPQGGKNTDMVRESFPDGITKISFAQDKIAATQIWAWVKPRLDKFGFFGTQVIAVAGAVS